MGLIGLQSRAWTCSAELTMKGWLGDDQGNITDRPSIILVDGGYRLAVLDTDCQRGFSIGHERIRGRKGEAEMCVRVCVHFPFIPR
jgi:hypothetical protein